VSDLAIHCEGIAKQYRIGEREPYRALRDTLSDAVTAPFRRLRAALHGGNGNGGNGLPTIWALKDVSFEIRTGEVVGIIGRNGAGKSTLLKILSRITRPTRGTAEIYGRVGSLLEVGTGFHPELTGRENVYLNGAILGMSKAEVARKFDEIVAFSELEEFIDTPVKRYSSGMYVRLAFAVAAHLEPEILIVDEVLAVGDAQFQKKCLSKMQNVGKSGRTVLFVSHNIPLVEALCQRAILLEAGEIVARGPALQVTAEYNAMFSDRNEIHRIDTGELIFEGIRNRAELDGISGGDDLVFRMGLRTGPRKLENVYVDFALVNEGGQWVVHSRAKFLDWSSDLEPNAHCELVYSIKAPMLGPGKYYLILYAVSGGQVRLWIENIDACSISARSYFGSSAVFDGVMAATVPPFKLEVRRECNSGPS
jgi:lipopolysaccharide transport system ATP-binding protein